MLGAADGVCRRFLRSQRIARPATATTTTPPTTPPAMAPEFDDELWVSAEEGWVVGLVVRVVVTLVVGLGVALVLGIGVALVVGVGVALVGPFIDEPGRYSRAPGR